MRINYVNPFSIGLIFLIVLLTLVPSSTSPHYSDSHIQDSILLEDYASPASTEGLEELKMNTNQGHSFEEIGVNEMPEGYDVDATPFRTTNYSYTANTNSGTYAGYIASQGVLGARDPQAYFSQTLDQTPTPLLSENLTLDFHWNTLDNPDINISARVYVSVKTINSPAATHEIRYYLSNNVITFENTTSLTCYLWNFTIGDWHHFSRDLGSDYNANPLTPPLEPSRRVYEITWYATTDLLCRDKLELLLDDVSLSDGIYSGWIQNGGFESGDGQFWDYGSYATPTFTSLSTDSTDGLYSLNMTTGVVEHSTAYGSVEKYSGMYPQGHYCSEPGMTVLDFDWKFTSSLESLNQNATLDIEYSTESIKYYCHLLLGLGADEIIGFSNSSHHIYVALDGFNVSEIWHNVHLDMYDFISQFGDPEGAISCYEFFVHASDIGSQATLLVDDFLIISSPTRDPGFEIDWYSSDFTPFAAWRNVQGDYNTIKRTSDSFSGNYACNLTPYATHGNTAIVTTSVGVDLEPDNYLDFWWRLDAMNNMTWSHAEVQLFLRNEPYDYYNIHYVLGSSAAYIPFNTTTSSSIYVDNFNSTGTWTNLHRNITQDIIQLTAPNDWYISSISVGTYFVPSPTNESRVSLIIDDIIITDGRPPVVESVIQLTSAPIYNDDVHIQINATDIRPGIDQVIVNYSTNGGASWDTVFASGAYDAYIPAQVYNAHVEYFIIAVDGVGLQSIDDNGGIYFSYTVGDNVNPTLTIDAPTDMAEVEGFIQINVTADDLSVLASGVDRVHFHVDGYVNQSDSIAPYSYSWQTDNVPLGMYTIEVAVYDVAGNSFMETINVTVVDTQNPEIDNPPDQDFYEGTTGRFVIWDPMDPRPNSYEVLVDGIPLCSGIWNSSSEMINISLDGLSVGVYNYTLVITDSESNIAIDTVFVYVIDGTTPYIDSPSDVEYDEFGTGNSVTWYPSDDHPAAYIIYLDGEPVKSGPWNTTLEPITISVDGLGFGQHNYTCVVADVSGNSITDLVWVTVLDSIVPTIDSPADIEYTEGEIGNVISWNPGDLHPLSFEIFRDDVSLGSHAWTLPLTTLEISVDGLALGEYNYTIVVTDASGNSISDSVIVVVTENTTPPTTETSTTTTTPKQTDGDSLVTILILMGVSGVAVILVLAVLLKKKS